MQRVQDHIKGLNFKYRVSLRGDDGVDYINDLGRFVDAQTIELVHASAAATTAAAAHASGVHATTAHTLSEEKQRMRAPPPMPPRVTTTTLTAGAIVVAVGAAFEAGCHSGG